MEEQGLTLTVTQAANALGLSRGLAYQLAKEGKLPTIRFGRRLVVPRKALDALLSGKDFIPKAGDV
jgi:excisionase family DNA binding protein